MAGLKEKSKTERPSRVTRRSEGISGSGGVSPRSVRVFQKIIRDHYLQNRRNFPWRRTRDPYRVLVSEVMLQQTGTERVLGKYGPFLTRFPDVSSLAAAPLREVLKMWQGLGYNRRALALKRLADIVMKEHHGKLPAAEGELMRLPGIGKYSASAIVTFSYNKPTLFIETNIRRVFIHSFFHDRANIGDAQIMPLIARTLDTTNPREWYYGLMDYGAMLKEKIPNPNRRSAHYRRQTPFHGSDRQLRGRILRALTEKGLSEKALSKELQIEQATVRRCLEQLQNEGFLKRRGRSYAIAQG